MKKLKLFLKTCEMRLEERWQKLSVSKQKKFVILFFVGYLLLTRCVVMTVWYDAENETRKQNPVEAHIQNPLIEKQKDGSQLKNPSSKPVKNQDHERH